MDIEIFLEKMNQKKRSRKYLNQQSILSLASLGDLRLARIRFLHSLLVEFGTVERLEEQIKILSAEEVKLEKEYSQILESEALRVFGRPWTLSDYKISGIGSSEFSTEAKERIRNNLAKTYKIQHSISVLTYVKRYL